MAIDLNDKTSNANTLTNSNGVEVTSSLPFAASSIAVDLESSTPCYLSAADSSSLSITGDMTLELWVKFESAAATNNRATFISKWDEHSGNKRSFEFGAWDQGGTKQIRFAYSTDGTYQGANDKRVNWSYSLATWYHVAVTYTASSATVKFYVDGSQLGTDQSASGTSIVDTTAAFAIGVLDVPPVASQSFDGVVDEVRVWNVVRTATEINDNKGVELTGSETGLKAYWPFEALGSPAVNVFPRGYMTPNKFLC